MAKWPNGQMAKWPNGQMAKWPKEGRGWGVVLGGPAVPAGRMLWVKWSRRNAKPNAEDAKTNAEVAEVAEDAERDRGGDRAGPQGANREGMGACIEPASAGLLAFRPPLQRWYSDQRQQLPAAFCCSPFQRASPSHGLSHTRARDALSSWSDARRTAVDGHEPPRDSRRAWGEGRRIGFDGGETAFEGRRIAFVGGRTALDGRKCAVGSRMLRNFAWRSKVGPRE